MKYILGALTSENINEDITSGSVLIDLTLERDDIKSRVVHEQTVCKIISVVCNHYGLDSLYDVDKVTEILVSTNEDVIVALSKFMVFMVSWF